MSVFEKLFDVFDFIEENKDDTTTRGMYLTSS